MNVRELRKSKGYTVSGLAELAGMPKRTLEDVERRGECTVSTAKKLARALVVTLDELCGFDKDAD